MTDQWSASCALQAPGSDVTIFTIVDHSGRYAEFRLNAAMVRILRTLRPGDVYSTCCDPSFLEALHHGGEHPRSEGHSPFPNFVVSLTGDGFHSKVECGPVRVRPGKITQADADDVARGAAGSERHEFEQTVLHREFDPRNLGSAPSEGN